MSCVKTLNYSQKAGGFRVSGGEIASNYAWLRARVIGISEGDTLTVLHDRMQVKVPFASAAEAVKAGYRKAGNCR
jgi:hypothetical protein